MLTPDHTDDRQGADEAAAAGNCEDALDTLYHFLDGELDDERRRHIQEHLDRCSPCLEAFDFQAELKLVVAQRCRETVPEHLRARVAEVLAEASGSFEGSEDRA